MSQGFWGSSVWTSVWTSTIGSVYVVGYGCFEHFASIGKGTDPLVLLCFIFESRRIACRGLLDCGLIDGGPTMVVPALGAAAPFQRGNQQRGRAGVLYTGVQRDAVGPTLQSVAHLPVAGRSCQQESAGIGFGFHLPFDG